MTALRLGVSQRHIGRRVNGQLLTAGHNRSGVVHFTVSVDRIPNGDGHTEETLPGDEPVARQPTHPVLIAHAHEIGVPGQFVASGQQTLAKCVVLRTVADVPLPGRDNFQRLVALFKKLHRVADGLRLAEHPAGFLEQFHHPCLRREHRLSGEFGIGGAPGLGVDCLWSLSAKAPVKADHGTVGQAQLAPPDHVRDVTKGADHGDAGALVRLCQVVREDGNLNVKQWGTYGTAEQRLVALIGGVRYQRHTGGKQFRPGGVNLNQATIGLGKCDPVVRPGLLAVLKLSLSNSGAERDVPQRRSEVLIRLAPLEVVQERQLRGEQCFLADCAVGLRPVHRQAEGAPEVFKLLLVLNGQPLTQLNEVSARDRLLIGGLT